MPYLIRPKKMIRRVAATTFGAALLVAAVPAVASAACPSSATTAALSSFGDSSAYTLLTGGSFESGASGWTLTNASVVSGVGAMSGSHMLVIESNGTAVSPQFCVSSEYPTFRFFERAISGTNALSTLNVSLRWAVLGMLPVSTTVATIKPEATWTLTPVLKLAKALPLLASQTLTVSVAFQPSGPGTWAVDDVYIDPYSR